MPHVNALGSVLRCLRRTIELLLCVTVFGGPIGYVVRDRTLLTSLFMYVPLVPVGMSAIIWDSVRGGRTFARARFGLSIAGVFAVTLGALTSIGHLRAPSLDRSDVTPLVVVQWNVRWGGGGGGRDGAVDRWASICQDIARRAPDIVVLSESPSEERLPPVPGMEFIMSRHAAGDRYFYGLAVCSRWPVALEEEAAIPTGRVMRARVAAPRGDVRILVVDGQSHPLLDRTPRLRAVAQLLREAEMSGKPVDIIAGDFNAVGRSVGFDAIAAGGYTSAGATARGWRPTWPAICPLWEIDHVWVSPRWSLHSVDRMTNLKTDHRGLVVAMHDEPLPPTTPGASPDIAPQRLPRHA